MLKRYRGSASYGSLNNRCLPYTKAITDNSKFNLETIANIYLDINQETAENHRRLKKANIDSKEESKGGGEKLKTCTSASECSTCGV